MEIDVKETIVKRKNLFQIFEEYEDSLSAERICDPNLRRDLKSILAHNTIRQQFLKILAIESFREVITRNSLRLFAVILRKGAGVYLSNALSRLIEFWDGIPAWIDLIQFLEGRWGAEITDTVYQDWIEESSLRGIFQDLSKNLLKKIQSQDCRIITMRIVIAESHAFNYFVKSCKSITLKEFLSQVRKCTSSNPNAPLWTECRQISKPSNGIWSQPPHASITELLPTARIPLIDKREVSITDLFQDFVKLFFGELVCKDVKRVQIRSIAHGDRKGPEKTEKSVNLDDQRDRLMNLEMVPIDDDVMDAEASRTSDPPESRLQLGHVPRVLPRIVVERYQESRPVTIFNVNDLSPVEKSAWLSTQKEKAVGCDKSIANDIMVGATSITAKTLSELPAVRTSVTIFEKADDNAPVTATEDTVTDYGYISKDRPSKTSTSRNKIDIVTTVGKRTAEDIAESYRADLPPLQAMSWDDDTAALVETERHVTHFNQIAESDRADFVPIQEVSLNDSDSTLVETERPDPYFNYHEGPNHMLFTIIRLLEDKDQDRIYLVPYDVAATDEIASMNQRHSRRVVNPPRSSLENEETNEEIGKARFKIAAALFDQKKSRSYVRACGLVVYKNKNKDVMMFRPKAKGLRRYKLGLLEKVIY